MTNTFQFFWPGRLISSSKGAYARTHPNNIVVFNANLCTVNRGKIWYGDIDVTNDEEMLVKFAAFLGEDIYILREMDGRFSNEAEPKLDRAVAIITKDGQVKLS